MAYSYIEYTADGSTTTFSVPFDYTAQADVKVFVGGVEDTSFTFNSNSVVQTSTTPASGVVVRVERNTDLDSRAVDFASGSVLTEEDLDNSNIQVYFAAQEAIDTAESALIQTPDGKWDAQSRVIKNVTDPTNPQDAVTKNYLENTWLTLSDKAQLNALNLTNLNRVYSSIDNVDDVADSITNVDTLAPYATDIDTISPYTVQINNVSTNMSDVNRVHTSIANVDRVATSADNLDRVHTSISAVDTVAADLNEPTSEIETVANSITNVNNVGTNIQNVIDVDANESNINAAVANASNINAAVANQSNITAAVANQTNINAVVANETNITAVSNNQTNINVVAGNNTNITTLAGIDSAITTVAGIQQDIQDLAAIEQDIQDVQDSIANLQTVANDLNEQTSDVTTVANSITNVDLVGGAISNVNTVADNITDVNNFADTYTISATEPTSPTPTVGDLWFDTTNDVMKVYASGGFVNAGSSVNGTSERKVYVAGTASGTYDGTSLTTFPVSYDSGYVDVFLNGVKMRIGTDVTATSGTNVVFATAVSSGDIVDIVAYGTFELSNFSIGDANNVDLTGLVDDQILRYNSATGNFQAEDLPTVNTDLVNDTTPQLSGDLDTNGQSILFGSSKWAIELDITDNDLLFKYNGTTVFKLASNGAVVSANDITAFGTP